MWIAITFLLLLGAGYALGNYFYNMALRRSTDRSKLMRAEHNRIDFSESPGGFRDVDLLRDAYLAAKPTDLYLRSGDGLLLHGILVSNPLSNGRFAMFQHGYSGKAQDLIGTAMHFYNEGYSCLLMDARGHGQSEGNYFGMGWPDRLDIRGWAALLCREHGATSIVLYGISMGGAAVMMAAGETLPDAVHAVVEDCGFSSAWDEFCYQFRKLYHMPPFPVVHLGNLFARARAGFSLSEASALRQVARTSLPILFIHGTEDTFVPCDMAKRLYAAASGPKEIFLVEGAAHGAAGNTAGARYWDVIFDFLSRHLPKEEH